MSDCQGCDGSGFYTPTFSPDVRVNCLTCNPDGMRGAVACAACGDNGEDCDACNGFGFTFPTPAAPVSGGAG